jgi:dTDP-4-amino-4,6-dideoxygalactose transaminase
LAPVRAAAAPERLTIDRNAFIEELKARNIGTSVHYRPLHMMSYYAEKYGYAGGPSRWRATPSSG